MDANELKKLDDLTLELDMDLNILNSALKSDDEDLEICSLNNFVERIYQKSNEIRNVFDSNCY